MRRTKFASVLIALILGSFIGAKAQYSYEKHFMAVGEEKQVDLPISVTNKNIIESYWSNGSPSYVEMTQLSDYSVKIKILKYISTTCYVQFDYYCGPSREHGNYTVFIDIKKPQKLDISASPSGGTINSGDRVYLSVSSSGSSVSGASIYYSLDGGSPKTSYSSSGITINESCTLKAYATKNGYTDSDVLTTNYTVKDPKIILSANPSGTSVKKGTQITLSTTYSGNPIGADIYYTTNNTSPSKSSKKYTSPITINEPLILRAIAYKDGYKTSDELVKSYTIRDYDDNSDYPTVVAGSYNSFLIKPDGCLWAWGDNSYGQLADGTKTDRKSPIKVMDNVANVSASSYQTLIVKTDESMYGCGQNNYGQLGDGTTIDRSTPTWIVRNVESVSTASENTLFVKTDGSLWGCGKNVYGELGNGYPRSQHTPVKVLDNVSSVSTNAYHTLIVKTDGTLWGCGTNFFGELSTDWSYAWSPFYIMSNVASASVGPFSSFVIKKDGSLWACGYNDHGQLGDGTTTDRGSFVKVMSDVKSVSAGYGHTLIVKTDGSLWACGHNDNGQLGDGTTIDRCSSVKISDDVVSASAGYEYSLFVKKDGSVWACGGNRYGELGDGTTSRKLSPVLIMKGQSQVFVESISITPKDLSMTVGDSNQLSVSILPDNATDKTVTWSTSNTDIAAVNEFGLVTAKAEGKAIITCEAKDNCGVKATCEVTVKASGIEINAANFPDKNFRNYLLEQDYGKDGIITKDEIERITTLNVSGKSINTLQGVEYFSALTSLFCDNNQLTSLDVSKNTALTSLNCKINKLTSLDVSNNTSLIYLHCYSNSLTSLDVSKNRKLERLSCYSNLLKSLDVSYNMDLTWLLCSENQLTSLDLSKNTVLERLSCENNQLKSLDLSKNTALTDLACYNNQLKSLNVSKNTALKELACFNNQLSSLDVSNNSAIILLYCYGNQIRGAAMDQLIEGLRPWDSSPKDRYGLFRVISDVNEGNVCTKNQVAAAKAKWWLPLCYNGSEWVEYEGSDEVPDIQLISVKSNNKDLTNLSPNDNLVLEGIFINTGATSVVDTRLRIWNQDMEAVAYSSSLSNEFKTNVQTTVKHEYALTNIPEGTYYATIQYFEEWDRQKWVYYKNLLVSFNVKKSSDGYKDGDFFVAKTQEGVDMSFQIISTTDKTCQVIGNEKCGNTYNGTDAYPAINNNYSGSITIPDHANGYKVVKLGDTSFSACDVKSIFIPDGIMYIGEEAFSWSENLSSLVIPKSIVSIGSEIIEGCSKLESIISYIQEPHDIDWKVFWSKWEVFTPATLYVPKGTKSTYLSKKGWGLFNNNIVEFDPSTFDPTTLGIHDVMMDDDKDAPIYDLFGRKLSQPNKGINIIGRKKVVVK